MGLAEETVFRGRGCSALAGTVSRRRAAVLSTAFFVLLHVCACLVRLYRFGTLDLPGLLGQCGSALVWGPVLCRLLETGGPLWGPVAVHFLYDLAYVLLIGGS